MSLFNALDSALEQLNNITYTDNGALSLKSSGSALVDFFSRAGAMRNQARNNDRDFQLVNLFEASLKEDVITTILILFYIRDIRGGQGERKIFQYLFQYFSATYPDTAKKVLHLIPEYGRWDDILKSTRHTSVEFDGFQLCKEALLKDSADLIDNFSSPISLAAKWMPSENAGKESRQIAIAFRRYLGIISKEYRLLLSTLRKKLDVVERKMCANDFHAIDYSKLPSRAAFMYRNAFLKRDYKRYKEYLDALENEQGNVKINSSTLYPYDIVDAIKSNNFNQDLTLEQQWKALPDFIGREMNAIAVVDTSGSMVNSSKPMPISVSVSLGLYLAERNKSEVWKDRFITFSERPSLIKLNPAHSITEKVEEVFKSDWGYNTNLQRVFDLILDTAKRNSLSQEDMPNTIYIISDMQFDMACADNSKSNFQSIDDKYKYSGYKRPNLVFWNVKSRNMESPVSFTEDGTVLVSGLSATTFKLVLQENVNPISMMLDTVYVDRYLPILNALQQ